MAFVAKLRNRIFRNTGACLSPVNAYLNLIGIETLGLRMERECQNALELAHWIAENYSDIIVNYPGLESSSWHHVVKEQFEHGYGAILTLRVGSKEKVNELTEQLSADGYTRLSEPRTTGNGYYESAIAAPEGNYVERTM